jgi:transcriptional regulator with XRE-family HTH domain
MRLRRRVVRGEKTNLRSGSMAPTEPSTVARLIGNEVRRLRRSLGLTGSELGAATGISAGMLSRIENASVSPSAATIKSLAKALNIPISQLLGEHRERADCSFVKAGSGVRIERRGPKSGHRYDLLGHSLGGTIVVEPYLVTLSHNVPCAHFTCAGVEYIHMLSGKVRYRHGHSVFFLETGDSLLLDAAVHHGPEGLVQVPIQYLSIIIFPRETSHQ